MDISVVIPVFNEENNVEMLHSQIKGVLRKRSHEIIFVDDGSTDNTFNNLMKIRDKDLKIIKLRKNFGQTAALSAGFKEAKGKIIVQMDGDLQNDPQDIQRMINKLEEGYDVVNGFRYHRKDTFFKKLLSKIANKFRMFLLRELIKDAGCSMRVYRRECFQDIDLYGEMHRYIPSLLNWKGFKIAEMEVNHFLRKYGKTKYGSKRLSRGLLDLLNIMFWKKYSDRPLHIFGGLGFILSLGGGIMLSILITLRLFHKIRLGDSQLPLLAVLMIIIGIQFFISGLMADISIKNYYGHNGRRTYSIERIVKKGK